MREKLDAPYKFSRDPFTHTCFAWQLLMLDRCNSHLLPELHIIKVQTISEVAICLTHMKRNSRTTSVPPDDAIDDATSLCECASS